VKETHLLRHQGKKRFYVIGGLSKKATLWSLSRKRGRVGVRLEGGRPSQHAICSERILLIRDAENFRARRRELHFQKNPIRTKRPVRRRQGWLVSPSEGSICLPGVNKYLLDRKKGFSKDETQERNLSISAELYPNKWALWGEEKRRKREERRGSARRESAIPCL